MLYEDALFRLSSELNVKLDASYPALEISGSSEIVLDSIYYDMKKPVRDIESYRLEDINFFGAGYIEGYDQLKRLVLYKLKGGGEE